MTEFRDAAARVLIEDLAHRISYGADGTAGAVIPHDLAVRVLEMAADWVRETTVTLPHRVVDSNGAAVWIGVDDVSDHISLYGPGGWLSPAACRRLAAALLSAAREGEQRGRQIEESGS